MNTRNSWVEDPARALLLQEQYDRLQSADFRESRICFGVAWFRKEADALDLQRLNLALDVTVNGGMFHGMVCGRYGGLDTDRDGVRYYACRY